MMSSEEKNNLIDAIFNEVEIYDKLLSKYNEVEDPLLVGWTPITSNRIEQKIYNENMKMKINTHLKKLIELLDQTIKSNEKKCARCETKISIKRLVTIPDAEICLKCRMLPIRVEGDNPRL